MLVDQQRELVSRLQAFVVTSYTNAEFRRRLEYRPEDALASHGLRWEVHGSLPVPRPLQSFRFDAATLFGVGGLSNRQRRIAEESTEIKLCLARCKPLLLIHAPEAEAASFVRRCHALGLTALLSAYEFSPEVDELKSGYSNSMSGIRPAQPGSGAWRTAVAGFEAERVMLAWLCLLFGWHALLGRLLGYPDCCSKAFPDRWVKALEDASADPAKLILQEFSPGGFAGTFQWETNVFARYFGREVIQHFPCRLDCPRTVELAQRNFAAWSAFDAEGAALTRESLWCPVLFTREQGVAAFPRGELCSGATDATLKFDVEQALIAHGAADLKDALQRCQGQLLATASHVQIGDRQFEGWLLGFE